MSKGKRLPQSTELFNLEEWNSHEEMIDGEMKKVERKVRTVLYNVPYAMANGMRKRVEIAPHLPGTFYKIPENVKPENKQHEKV